MLSVYTVTGLVLHFSTWLLSTRDSADWNLVVLVHCFLLYVLCFSSTDITDVSLMRFSALCENEFSRKEALLVWDRDAPPFLFLFSAESDLEVSSLLTRSALSLRLRTLLSLVALNRPRSDGTGEVLFV